MTARRGTRLVVAMVGLAVGLATFAVWFQWRQTRKCLAFYGPEAARRIQSAPRVELWELDGWPDAPRRRRDITGARGLVHLRRGLVEDANFEWSGATDLATDGPAEPAWDAALAFFDSSAATEPATLLLIAFAEPGEGDGPRAERAGGRIAVAGRHSVAGLGRLRRGLERWLDDVAGADDTAGPPDTDVHGGKSR